MADTVIIVATLLVMTIGIFASAAWTWWKT